MLAYELADGYTERQSTIEELSWDINDLDKPKFILASTEKVKNKVLDDYVKSIARTSKYKTNVNKGDLDNLKEWYPETATSLAKKISASLLNSNNYLTTNSGMKGTNQIITGAEFSAKVNERLKSDNNMFNSVTQKKLATIATLVQEQLQLYLNKIVDCEDDSIYSIIKLLAEKNTTGITNEYSQYLKETGLGTLELVNEDNMNSGDKKFYNNIKNLHNIMLSLENLQNGLSSVYYKKTKKNGKEKSELVTTPESFIRSLTAIFNAIGGEAIGEALVVSCVNNAEETIDNSISNTNKSLNQLKNVTAKQVQHETRTSLKGNRVQIKPDIWIDFEQNGVKLTLGGSIKIRQTKKQFKFGTRGGEVSPASNTTLGTWLKIVENNSQNFSIKNIKNFEQAWSARYDSQANNKSREITNSRLSAWTEKWEEMKDYARYIIALSELAGTLAENDVASIFIVNYQVFSIYDIISNLDIDKEALTTSGTGSGTFIELRNEYRKSHRRTKDNFDKYSQDMIKNIYSKKLTLKINSMKLESILKNL